MAKRDREESHKSEIRHSKTISELKAENKILKRRISRLEKRIMRMGNDYDEESPYEESPQPVDPKQPVKKCTECDSTDLVEIDTPNRIMVICKNCKTRF